MMMRVLLLITLSSIFIQSCRKDEIEPVALPNNQTIPEYEEEPCYWDPCNETIFSSHTIIEIIGDTVMNYGDTLTLGLSVEFLLANPQDKVAMQDLSYSPRKVWALSYESVCAESGLTYDTLTYNYIPDSVGLNTIEFVSGTSIFYNVQVN